MNKIAEAALVNLSSTAVEEQIESALVLGILLERALWPGRYDSTHELVMPKEFLEVRLDAESEVDELLVGMCGALGNQSVSLSTKISLSTILGKSGRAKCISAILRLLEEQCGSLSEGDAYSLLASFLPSFNSSEPRSLVLTALSEYHTDSVLELLAIRRSHRLDEQLERLRRCIAELRN